MVENQHFVRFVDPLLNGIFVTDCTRRVLVAAEKKNQEVAFRLDTMVRTATEASAGIADIVEVGDKLAPHGCLAMTLLADRSGCEGGLPFMTQTSAISVWRPRSGIQQAGCSAPLAMASLAMSIDPSMHIHVPPKLPRAIAWPAITEDERKKRFS